MDDGWTPTGVWDAVIIDLLQRSGLDLDAIMAMSAQERIDAVRKAATDGQLEDDQVATLRRMGISPE